jgi:hypothetical protein
MKTQYFPALKNAVSYGFFINQSKEFCMKNLVKQLAIIALVAVIGFSFASCDNGGGGGGDTGTAPTITTTSLPNGEVGTAYNQTLAVTGDKHITWSVEGTLPDGLTLNASTGAISGTPTVANTFNFTVKATNAKGDGTQSLSITIASTHTPNTETGLCTVCNALTYQLGNTGPGGGKIFYRLEAGFTTTDNSQVCHYLEAAPADMTYLRWASSGFTTTDIPGTGEAIGTGRKNTALILATDVNAPAAKACKDYSNGGKTDWFLPSKDELNQLYVNRASVGNMGTDYYWSSSQFDNSYSWSQRFSDGNQYVSTKNNTNSVRAVRAF